MKNIIIPNDETAIDRVTFMQSQADDTLPDYRYERVLTDEELDEERITFTEVSIELAKLEFEKAEVVADFNRRIKTEKQNAERSLSLLRTGRMEVVENVYQIADFNEGRVGIYNQFGELISDRPMKKSERGVLNRSLFRAEETETNNFKTGTDE